MSTMRCCVAGGGEEAEPFNAEDIASMCKALGHPVRVQLLCYLSSYGACYFGNLADIVPLAPSTISQHVTILKQAGLVCGSSDEQRVSYCINPARLGLLKQMIGSL
jgi:ArsR family transcriptional regulator, arsenate/arsenite/antimonite-responsive transcriptional repressor